MTQTSRSKYALIVATLIAAPALAHPFDTINYECKQIDAVKDGIKCRVRYEGSQPILFIRYMYSRKATPNPERTAYLVSTTQRNFVALGGVTILRRFTLDGIPAQQLCTSLHRRPIVCNDPLRVSELENMPWPF
jgi:hypothetical protein